MAIVRVVMVLRAGGINSRLYSVSPIVSPIPPPGLNGRHRCQPASSSTIRVLTDRRASPRRHAQRDLSATATWEAAATPLANSHPRTRWPVLVPVGPRCSNRVGASVLVNLSRSLTRIVQEAA